jgi:hypothetical protein
MNQESSVTIPPTTDGSPATAPHYELDIVGDCGNLKGKFPSNVAIKFIFWSHGTLADGNNYTANAARLAPHCLQADLIAQELAYTAHATPQDVQHEYRLINDCVAGRNKHKTLKEIYGDLSVTQALGSCLGLATAMTQLGRTKPARFVGIDEMRHDNSLHDMSSGGVPDFQGDSVHFAALLRRREAIAIRQLYDQAHQLGADGRPHQIAIIYGAQHTAVSVATRRLGATTSRVFVDKPLFEVSVQLARALRYKPETAVAPEYGPATAAIDQGSLILALAQQLGLTETDQATKTRVDATCHTKLGLLCLRATKGLLTKPDRLAFKAGLDAVEPFLAGSKRIPLTKRRAVKRAVQQVIKLSENLV